MKRKLQIFRSSLRIAFRSFYLVSFLTAVISCLTPIEIGATSAQVDLLRIEGTIVPVVADYVERGIKDAENNGSIACIIELDTPGGLLSATEDIIKSILNASLPVIVYVSPRGAWAASAGTFITVSSHIAAMAPGTTIGAAHPVSVGEEMPEEVKKKTVEYSAAYIRSIAESRGRNAEQAELAVTESKSFTSTQAIEQNLVDFEAVDLQDLMKKLDGRQVKLSDGSTVTLHTENADINKNPVNWVEDFLHKISDPNIAYVLLSLATIGIITEITNPGMIFPGVIGGISLLFAFYSLGNLNAHWAGLLLIIMAFALFIAELFTSSFGILTAGGVTALLIGSFMLFTENTQVLQINPILIFVVVFLITAFFILVVGAVIRGQRRKTVTGGEGMIGRSAVVVTEMNPKGTVLIEGEHWNAVMENGSAQPEEEVIVSKMDGLKLIVTKKDKK